MLDNLQPISKAIAAAVAGALIAFLQNNNIVISDDLNNAIQVVIAAVIAGVVVFVAPKNKSAKK